MIYPHKFCATNCFCTPLHFTCRVDIWKRISCAFSSTHSQSTNIVPQNKKRARFPWALAPYLHNIFLIYTLFFSPYCTVRYVTLPLLISREQPINTMFPLFSSYLTRSEELWKQWVVRCACVYMDECVRVCAMSIHIHAFLYIYWAYTDDWLFRVCHAPNDVIYWKRYSRSNLSKSIFSIINHILCVYLLILL